MRNENGNSSKKWPPVPPPRFYVDYDYETWTNVFDKWKDYGETVKWCVAKTIVQKKSRDYILYTAEMRFHSSWTKQKHMLHSLEEKKNVNGNFVVSLKRISRTRTTDERKKMTMAMAMATTQRNDKKNLKLKYNCHVVPIGHRLGGVRVCVCVCSSIRLCRSVRYETKRWQPMKKFIKWMDRLFVATAIYLLFKDSDITRM